MKVFRVTTAYVWTLGFAAALLLAPGCTYFDEDPSGGLKGSPFTPDQPEASVTLTGKMNSDPIVVAEEGCVPGGTFFWGTVTNTGDLAVTNVSISITVLDGAGGSLGTWSGPVYNGETATDTTDPENPIVTAGTSLDLDQSGNFTVCTTVPYGAAAGTEYRTNFTTVEGTQ